MREYTLKGECFRHKVISAGGEFKRCLYMGKVKVNGELVKEDIYVMVGDIIEVGNHKKFVVGIENLTEISGCSSFHRRYL